VFNSENQKSGRKIFCLITSLCEVINHSQTTA
jgi:hypothetical protein